MRNKYLHLHCLIAISLLYFQVCFGQVSATNSSLKNTLAAITDIREKLPIEKLYLQTDKPYYNTGDTLRFKAYLLNADYLTPSVKSGLLYAELDDASNIAVKRIMVPVNGVGWGDIALDKDVPDGSYTLRAYTNWMRNFDESYVFKKAIYVSALNSGATIVNAGFKMQKQADKNNVQASLRFTGIDKQPLRLKDMQLWVKEANRTLFKDKTSTNMDGGMEVNFNLPDKTDINKLNIQVQEIKKEENAAKLFIPVSLNRPENTDLQFMPEGGRLVAGITTRIGFKAIAEDGKGAAVKGSIYNSKQQAVTTLQSLHAGMGSFELTPQAGETYTAKLTLPNGTTKDYLLPAVNLSGTTLKVIQSNDSLTVQVNAQAIAPGSYYIIGQARGVACYAAAIRFAQGKAKLTMAQSLFPTGITRFTLLNNENKPVNERLVYTDHQDNLRINIAASKNTYAIRDSIALAIQVTDKEGKPVKGQFSLAVTDDSQVKTDSIGTNISNDLLLTSDLKGTIEEPGYYFNNDGSVAKITELDNLLLTQGWVGYDWKQVFEPTLPTSTYKAETEFMVQGLVTNAFNKPIANTGVLLQSMKPEFIKDTVTDKDGRFIFKGFAPVDTAQFILQAKNHNGKAFNVKLTVDEFRPPMFTPSTQQTIPWYVNSDTVLLHNLVAKQQAELKLAGPHVLKEVTIKAKKIIKDSNNPNGEGVADEVLDEKDMEKAGKMTLMQIIKKLSGFADANPLMIHSQYLILIIDGVNITESYMQTTTGPYFSVERYQHVKSYLDYITAEDILGIESSFNSDKTIGYALRYYYSYTIHKGPPPFAYVEVTTRSGNGSVLQSTPGIYEYKPLPFTLAKQFYRPKYTTKNNTLAMGTDLRSTIHWEPNVVTDANGKATVSFYSADMPATYSITMEGSNFNGQVGFKRQKVSVHAIK